MWAPVSIMGTCGAPDSTGALPVEIKLIFEDGTTYNLAPTVQLHEGVSFEVAGIAVHCDLGGDVAVTSSPSANDRPSTPEPTERQPQGGPQAMASAAGKPPPKK